MGTHNNFFRKKISQSKFHDTWTYVCKDFLALYLVSIISFLLWISWFKSSKDLLDSNFVWICDRKNPTSGFSFSPLSFRAVGETKRRSASRKRMSRTTTKGRKLKRIKVYGTKMMLNQALFFLKNAPGTPLPSSCCQMDSWLNRLLF